MLLRSMRWSHWLCLTAILILAGAVRCFNLSDNSLWTDEYLSLECSSGWARSDLELNGTAVVASDLITLKSARPWTTIWPSIAADENHPPLYFLLLRLWRNWFGDSPAAIRSLSVLASLVAIVLIFALGLHVHSPAAGLWAALVMALASPQIQQAQDARAYMLVTAACLAGALALVRIERRGPTAWNCIALATAALVAPLMHYMAFASLAAMVIYAAFFMNGSARKAALSSLAICFTVFLFLWGPAMVQQHYRMIDDTAWLVDQGQSRARTVLGDLCTLPARLLLDLDASEISKAWCGGAVLIVPLLLCRKHRELLLWWLWLIVPVGAGLIIDVTTHRRSLSMIRYALAAGPALYLMAGMLAAHLRRIGWIPAAVIALCCAICVPSLYQSELPDYREVSRFIARSSNPSDPVIFVCSKPDIYSSEALLSVMYYLAGQHHPLYVLQRPPSAVMMQNLQMARHICVIADGSTALNRPIVPGLAIDRAELLDRIAVVGIADPPPPAGQRLARATFSTDPSLKAMLGMR
jgi:uncharacterized membrane protein